MNEPETPPHEDASAETSRILESESDPNSTIEADPQPPGRKRLIALIPNDGRQPPDGQTEDEAEAIWSVVTASWHPAILVHCGELPGIECIDYPDHPYAHEIRVMAAGASYRLPSDYRMLMADAGGLLLEAEVGRSELVKQILACLPDPPDDLREEDPLVADFLALGAAWWWQRDLTTAMGHPDCLDHESLRREILAGALAWCRGDTAAAASRLRAGFELLTQARERYYPVDAYILDFCLLDPSTPAGTLADALEARAPVTFLAPARAIEALAACDPDRIEGLCRAIDEGWADVIGGAYGEADEPLRPLESILWQFRKGAETYRRHLEDRTTETVARRRFGLYPQLPQIARRHGFRFALHLGLDDGQYPIPPETKRLWEGPDGSQLETLTRPPIAASRASEGTRLAWRVGQGMKSDHVATVAMIHWPNAVAGWYRDLRRIAAYSPVLARWHTAGDYFQLTDRPYESYRPDLDQYRFPYLSQAVVRGDETPISRRETQAGLRARLDAALTLISLGRILGVSPSTSEEEERPPWLDAEDAVESGRFLEARDILSKYELEWAQTLVESVCATATESQPGYLILNPLCVPRKAPVLLPDAPADLRPEGPLLAAQFTADGVRAVVDLPAFGYVWIPRDSGPNLPPCDFGAIGTRGRVLYNDFMEVEIDETTGGLRGLRATGEPSARIGQQLVIAGLRAEDGTTVTTRMNAERFEAEYGGPALVQAITEGQLLDPTGEKTLARFRQCFRLWKSRPIFELEVTLSDLDPAWLDQIARADPWSRFLACRWAWPDADAELRRTSLLSPVRTGAERPETPDVLDITTPRSRTALLFGGLAHHRRHGSRMLDTLLVAGRESSRRFRIGVVLDQENPFRASLDFRSPDPVVTAVPQGPPGPGPSGWFFQVDHRGVAITRIESFTVEHEGSRIGGLVFHLLETSGRAARCRLRLARNPVRARQTDFNGETILDLSVTSDTVSIDMTPHELARVEVTMG